MTKEKDIIELPLWSFQAQEGSVEETHEMVSHAMAGFCGFLEWFIQERVGNLTEEQAIQVQRKWIDKLIESGIHFPDEVLEECDYFQH